MTISKQERREIKMNKKMFLNWSAILLLNHLINVCIDRRFFTDLFKLFQIIFIDFTENNKIGLVNLLSTVS